jgi:hypothetical protein
MGDDETTSAEQQPGYAERDAGETTEQTGGDFGEAPQGGEHFGEAPLGEQDPGDVAIDDPDADDAGGGEAA